MRRFRPSALALACVITLQPFAGALAQDAGAAAAARGRRAAEQIKASELKDYLHFVASDEMEGRDTPSRGLDLTAKFIALNLSLWGVKPAGDDGTYFQRISLKRTRIDPAASHAARKLKKRIPGNSFSSDFELGKL